MTAQQLRTLIQQTLQPLNLYSPGVEELLCMTCAQESALGKYRVQMGGGPALGIFQMEPKTYDDIWDNFLKYRPSLVGAITRDVSRLENNDEYAIFMARCQYLRAPEAVPAADDVEGLWTLYKKRYNTPL